jgi:oxygen-dependent protoporphyrinogen oxidase
MSRIAIVGGGISGLTAAWQLHQLGQEFTLYEASLRLGGTVRTVHRDGFTVELGPDGWVTEKPWAAELARDLGLADELTPSNDATRVTYILRDGQLVPMPDGMRMMVPTELTALEASPLFSPAALAAYAAEPHRAEELRADAPHHHHDESVASFVERHFGREVLDTLAAPLLSGVFGGDVATLSVRAVMPAFVQMEREHGSLILALQSKNRTERAAQRSIFTTLRTGTQTLVDAMAAALPAASIHLNSPVSDVLSRGGDWTLETPSGPSDYDSFDHLILATPAHVTRKLLAAIDPEAADRVQLEATSAVLVAFAFDESFSLPQGFGFLVPPGESSRLLAATFVDQKFPGRVPPGKRLLRAFFGGPSCPALLTQDNESLTQLALTELQNILGPLPIPAFALVQRWPLSLPQYAVGHLERIAELAPLLPKNLHLLGNAFHGVGLPDLIRDARALAHSLVRSLA